MASLQLYTQGFEQERQTFTLCEANLLEATKNTHYVENWLGKTTNPITQEDVWIVNISIPVAGGDYVSPNKNYQPLPSYPLEKHEDQGETNWYPSYIDVSAQSIPTQPTDWDLHWRDKYNTMPIYGWDSSTKFYYYSDPTLPKNYSGDTPDFIPATFFETNTARHIYWTMDGNYFPFEWGWFKGSTSLDISTIYYGLRFSNARYGAGNINWTNQWQNVNNPRFNGVNGQLVYGNNEGTNYLNFVKNCGATSSLSGDQLSPKVYFNFIGFKYRFIDDTGETPIEKVEEFIGLIAWEETSDGLFDHAQLMALSKNFFGVRKKPANGGPISGIQGGNGTFSAPSDNRGDRNGTTASNIARFWGNEAGKFSPGYNNYRLSGTDVGAFREMVENLWDPDVVEGFANLMMNPLDAIICCHQVPDNLAPAAVSSEIIRAAKMALSETAVPTFTNWMTYWHGGDIDISEYTGSFADYTNTAVYIHLPYIGTQLIDVAACMDGWLAIDYLTDVISGECTALITTCDKFGNTEIRYEFKGDCSRTVDLHQRVPLGTRIAQAAIPAIVNIAGAAITGGMTTSIAGSEGSALAALAPAGSRSSGLYGVAYANAGRNLLTQYMSGGAKTRMAALDAAGSALTSAAQAAVSGAQTSSSNASGGNVSSPIDTQIWILITRPQWSNPELYERERAYPSDISGLIGDFQGFLAIASAELNGISCTDVERGEIMERLATGVLLS